MKIFGLDKSFIRAFDLLLLPGKMNISEIIELNEKDEVIFVELKTTKKKLTELPKGFFSSNGE